ncbi:MAG: hypothetical protein ACYTDY_13755 [Planctomycetota bacterium]|jgi:hypothetical protein
MKNPLNMIILLAVLGLMIASGIWRIDSEGDEFLNAKLIETVGLFIAGWLTFAILSFLYKDNPFYRAAEHLMVGLAMGYFAIYYAFEVLETRWWDRLYHGELREREELFGSAEAFRYALIIPAALGLMMLTRIIPKVAFFSRWSIGTMIGITSGLAIPVTLQARVFTQIQAATTLPIDYMTALSPQAGVVLPGFASVPGWQVGVPLMILATVCGLVYFFFSVPHRGVIAHAARVGIWGLMIGFGASFGYTVMARLSLFIGRVLFIVQDWLDILPPV